MAMADPPVAMESSQLFLVADKTILVTGGTRGIGFMIALGFVANGARRVSVPHSYHTAMHAIYYGTNGSGMRTGTASIERRVPKHRSGVCVAVAADLTCSEDRQRLLGRVMADTDRLHVLVNNAGTNWAEPFERYSEAGWRKVIELNLTTVFLWTQQCLPLLKRAASTEDPGRILHIGSIHGLSPLAAGLHMLTRHMALHLASSGITCNAIAPGSFPSKMMAATLESSGDVIRASIPLQRLGRPADMAGVCLWLCSPAGSYVTGSVVVVDGGALLKSELASPEANL